MSNSIKENKYREMIKDEYGTEILYKILELPDEQTDERARGNAGM